MKRQMKLKLLVDMVMTALLPCQMAYMLIGETAHEWMGTAMLVMFIVHNILNRKWYGNLFKGRYSAGRVLRIGVNFMVFLSMAGLMVSGIILSREVFAFLPLEGGLGFARTLHMVSAYWGFILMSVHLGLHWGMVMNVVKKAAGISSASKVRSLIVRAVALAVCCFGGYALIRNNIADYLLMRSQFVFFDMEMPLAVFFAEYLAMMGLWGCLAYYVDRVLATC